MLSHCFNQCSPKRGLIWNKLVGKRRMSREDFDHSLWNSVCVDIKGNATGLFVAARMRELYEAMGDRALEESNCHDLMTYIKDFEYENTLLIWHISTEICINTEGHVGDAYWKRRYSKILSIGLHDVSTDRIILRTCTAVSYIIPNIPCQPLIVKQVSNPLSSCLRA
ncbi:hypothetical protein MLD38_037024 [Melastoma candidum]|uniref:Uncharacterized protein n=1 Tax=Melastoma candidum TaxID=119954 RepID=A0ACB9LND0_9MYRT|nr:hypothetical protein MLD38_037024 [Melastoma candidum]